jgi:hypothetical protein
MLIRYPGKAEKAFDCQKDKVGGGGGILYIAAGRRIYAARFPPGMPGGYPLRALAKTVFNAAETGPIHGNHPLDEKCALEIQRDGDHE